MPERIPNAGITLVNTVLNWELIGNFKGRKMSKQIQRKTIPNLC